MLVPLSLTALVTMWAVGFLYLMWPEIGGSPIDWMRELKTRRLRRTREDWELAHRMAVQEIRELAAWESSSSAAEPPPSTAAE